MGGSCTCLAEELIELGSGIDTAGVLCWEFFADGECAVGLIIFMGGCSSM